ncbi:MAG: barstar family protein [Solirubrobacteraceae bacterium]|nr:barstar family protein [Solirubrobacteraceae bacterium]
MPVIAVDLTSVRDWEGFHDAFARTLGLMDGYGGNMDAWIDCLTHVDEDDGTSRIVVEDGDVLTLRLTGMDGLRTRRPDIHAALLDAAAFVNHRRIEVGERPILALAYP